MSDDEIAPLSFPGPVKHSIAIAGHKTSISLEPPFWDALRRAANEEGVAINQLVARIDDARIAGFSRSPIRAGGTVSAPSNLASAIRIWLWERYCE